MDRNFIVFGGMVLSVILLLSNATGVPQTVTGAPGESGFSCDACHSGGNFNTAVRVELIKDGQQASFYQPGELYQLRVIVSGENNVRSFGFQLVCLKASDNTDMGVWSNLGERVRTRTMLNRVYLQQSNHKTDGIFTAQWRAPQTDVGPVRFYYSGLGVNLNGNVSGDQHDMQSYLFPSSSTSSVSDADMESVSAEIFPNPAHEAFELKFSGQFNYSIYDSGGILQLTGSAENRTQLDINHLCPGVYLVRISDIVHTQRTKIFRLIKI